jgi:hypothetical protein
MQIKELAVDDEEIILLYFERLLKGWNYQVENHKFTPRSIEKNKT